MPLFGPPNVEEMKAKGNSKGLWKLMVAGKGDLSTQASKALVATGAQAVIPLLDLVKGNSAPAEEKSLAVSVLKAIGAPAVEPLLAVLKGKDDDRRLVALQALGAIGDPRAGGPLLDLLKNNQVSFVSQLVAVSFAAKIMGPRAQDPLLAYLQGGSSTFVLMKAEIVAKALGDVGDQRSIDVLVELTKTIFKDAAIGTNSKIRASAAEALGKIAGRLKESPEQDKAVSALAGLLKDTNPGLRAYACLGLGQVIGHHATEPLIAALKDSQTLVRSSAAFGLRGSLDPGKVEPLIALLTDSDKNIRANAAEGLGSGSDPRALAPLIECLKDQETAVRDAAVKSLMFFPNDKLVLQHLVACLNDVDPSVRSSVVMVLGTCGEEAVDPLINSLKDKDANVRTQAALHLGHFKDSRCVGPLIEALKDQDWTMRYTCVTSLGQIASPQAVDGLKIGLNDPNEYVRQAAVEAMKQIETSR